MALVLRVSGNNYLTLAHAKPAWETGLGISPPKTNPVSTPRRRRVITASLINLFKRWNDIGTKPSLPKTTSPFPEGDRLIYGLDLRADSGTATGQEMKQLSDWWVAGTAGSLLFVSGRTTHCCGGEPQHHAVWILSWAISLWSNKIQQDFILRQLERSRPWSEGSCRRVPFS